MAISFKEADDLRQELQVEYQERHDDMRRLRDFWHGRYWEQWSQGRTGLQSLFRDIARKGDDDTPDFKVVHNIVHEVCLKYQTYLSPLPMIRVYRDPGKPELKKQQATKKERYLYGLWGQRPVSMSHITNRMAWYLPLMGDCFLGAYPDMENKTIRPLLRSPEYAFPVQGYDGSSLDAVMFRWETTRTKAARQFPNYDPDANKGRLNLRRKTKREKCVILEYSDGKEFSRWVDDQKVTGVEHDYGFNLFDQVNFIYVPDEPWNHGAVEQAISMNEAENLMRSLMLQAVVENVFPKYVLIDPSKAPEELDMGPGAVWGVNPGGDIKVITPPLNALPVQQSFLAENERAIKQGTGMNEANFGSFPGGSTHITGKAINEMQGGGAGSIVELVQGVGLGTALSSWNEKALCLGRKMFEDDTINVAGFETASSLEIKPQYFSVQLKGKELVGSFRNEVVFQPLLDLHSKLVMNLQAMGAGLVSKEHSRNQLGIPDSEAMDEEILGERLQDVVLGAIEQELIASAGQPEAAESAEERALAYLQGSPAPPPSGAAPAAPATGGLPPGPPPGGPAGAGAPPGGGGGMPIANLPGGGQLAAPALRMPPGSALPGAEAPPNLGGAELGGAPPPGEPTPQGGDILLLPEVVQTFQGIETEGRVFLVGEIVQGQTDDTLEVAVTDGADRQVLSEELPQYAGRLSFTVVTGEPKEQYIEVTSGATPDLQGEEADLDAILSEV